MGVRSLLNVQVGIHVPQCQRATMTTTRPTSNPHQQKMVHTYPVNLGKLFKVPRKRSPEHLTGMNIQEHYRVAAAVIAGDANLPHDDNLYIPRSHLSSLALVSLTPYIEIPSLPFLLPYWRNSEVLPCTRRHKHRFFSQEYTI